ncbi:hypothetical protein [Microbacterium rhizophilus]|uniref:hypothetical protein n=1 Tax=Microbacterium rhizophilus TaxID=3138934 RepID=UPI0031EDA7FB
MTLTVREAGTELAFGIDDLNRYHGPGFPGGVAHAYKVLERTLPLLDGGAPPERREIRIDTAFGGPGARDAFELVTRGVTDGRYTVDPSLALPERDFLARYVFRLSYRGAVVTAVVREGFVVREFIDLGAKPDKTDAEHAHLEVLKREMADRLLSAPADEAYDVV